MLKIGGRGAWLKFFKEEEHKPFMKILLSSGIICTLISVQSQTYWFLKAILEFLDILEFWATWKQIKNNDYKLWIIKTFTQIY